ncbi:hypothetical protein IVB02_29625, partial [Bradyrhizobium sp. 166]|nr:hypothetical protein [Bradyrhizobium sp. 166]
SSTITRTARSTNCYPGPISLPKNAGAWPENIAYVDGVSDFNALHSRRHDHEVQFCAFDILAEGGDDLRMLPLSMRKTSLERLLARRPEGVFVNPFERGELGPDLFRAACNMGLEGLVAKRRDRPYQAGRSRYWVKVKNRSHPAMDRVLEHSHNA